MAALPYMPFYVAEYLADAGHLNAMQSGAYLFLIMMYWQRGKALPDDDRTLAAMARVTPDEWQQMRPILEPFFAIDGEWVHGRVEKELEKARQKTDQAKTARASRGKKSTDVQRTFNGRSTDDEPASNGCATDVPPLRLEMEINNTSPLTREAEWTGLIKAFDEGLTEGAGRKVRAWPNPKDSVTAMRLHKAGVTPEIVKAIAAGEAQSKVAQGREPATALAYIESRCIEALTSPPARASPAVPKMSNLDRLLQERFGNG